MAARISLKSLWRLALALPLTCLASGCNDLPVEQYIEYPRILGLKARVIASPLREINPQDSRPFAEALPFETITLDEWVVSPQGPVLPNNLDGRWIACERLPSTGTSDCLRGYIRDKDPVLQQMQTCPEFDGLPGLGRQQSPELPARTPPCLLPPNQRPVTYTIPLSLNMLLGASMEFWYIASIPGQGPRTSDCIKDLLEGVSDLNDNCLYGVTSVDIGPKEQLQELLLDIGIEPDSEDPEGQPNIPDQPNTDAEGQVLPPPEGNRHPRLSSMFYTIEQDEVPITPATPYNPGEIIQAPLGSSVRIDISLPIAELQTFPVLVNDGEDIVIRTEEYESAWYYTWGSLDAANDKPEVAVERWILEPNKEQEQPEKSPGDQVFAYFAVRDDRGGIDWSSFSVQLLPASNQSQSDLPPPS